MARRIEEGDGAAVYLDGICADMLRDAAGLAGDDVGMADIVQKRGLAVVNVTHNNDDGGAGHEILRLILMVVDEALLNGDDDLLLDLAAEFHRHERGGVIVYYLRNGRKNTHLESCFMTSDAVFFMREASSPTLISSGDLHLELLLFRYLKLEAVHLVALLLAALGGSELLAGALLGLAGYLLLIAAAEVIVLGLHAGHIFKLLVVLFDVDRSAAAGIDDALFRHLAGCAACRAWRPLRFGRSARSACPVCSARGCEALLPPAAGAGAGLPGFGCSAGFFASCFCTRRFLGLLDSKYLLRLAA